MDAKQIPQTATLFVRIPAALKSRIDASARARHTSIAKEAERLLGEQLTLDIPALRKQELMEIELKRLRGLEHFVASFALYDDIEEARKQLYKIRELIVNRRANFIKIREDAKLREQHRVDEAAKAKLEKKNVPPVGPLVNLGMPSKLPEQLSEEERRRKHLIAELSRRARGTKKQLADALGWTPPQISQVLSHPAAVGHRPIKPELARRIEKILKLKDRSLEAIEQCEISVTMYRQVEELERVLKTLPRQRTQTFS